MKTIIPVHQFLKTIEIALSNFPSLQKQIPNKWISSITYEKLESYRIHRTDKYWEHSNLPFTAYDFMETKYNRVNLLFKSILSSLDWFANNMISFPGAKKILKPLWENPWNINDNPFWSVVSEVKLTELFIRNKRTILGFDRK